VTISPRSCSPRPRAFGFRGPVSMIRRLYPDGLSATVVALQL
jgi:hypothetical protein